METQNHVACKLLALLSLFTTYIGTIMPIMRTVAEDIMPILQAGAYIIAMGSGGVAIFKGIKKRKSK